MAYVSDFTFNGLSRIGNDSCSQDINSIENSQACSYTLQNYFAQDCNMKNAKSLATTQPCVNYSGCYVMGAGGCNFDESSELLIGGIQTNPKARIDLFGRPFATVPFLGRGNGNVDLETQILRNKEKLESTRKSLNPTSEIENNPSEFVLVASLAPFTVTVAAITGCPVASTIFPVIVFCCANADGTPASSNSMKTNCK